MLDTDEQSVHEITANGDEVDPAQLAMAVYIGHHRAEAVAVDIVPVEVIDLLFGRRGAVHGHGRCCSSQEHRREENSRRVFHFHLLGALAQLSAPIAVEQSHCGVIRFQCLRFSEVLAILRESMGEIPVLFQSALSAPVEEAPPDAAASAARRSCELSLYFAMNEDRGKNEFLHLPDLH